MRGKAASCGWSNPMARHIGFYLTITTAKDTQGDKVQRVVLTDITEAKFLSRAMLQDDSGLHA